MNHVPLAFQGIYGSSDERSENGDGEEGREWRLLPSLLYAYNLVLCGQSENNLKQWWGILLRCVEERI